MSFSKAQRVVCDVQIRWMIRRDMPEVLQIEDQSAVMPWGEDDFLACLRQRNCIGMVAEHQERIVGFMVYELLKSQLHVLNFAVSPIHRRQQVGTRMMEKLVNKLTQQRRQDILLEVRETNLVAQLFFRSQGLKAARVLRDHFTDGEDRSEDAFLMLFRLPSQTFSELNGPHHRNRISTTPAELDSDAIGDGNSHE